jgi:hypothetical protein
MDINTVEVGERKMQITIGLRVCVTFLDCIPVLSLPQDSSPGKYASPQMQRSRVQAREPTLRPFV